MVYHRSEPGSGDPRRQGRFSREEDTNSREPRRDDRYSETDPRNYRDDRYSGRFSKDNRGREDGERSRSRDRSDGSRYRDNRDSGRGFDKPRFNSGPRFNSEDNMSYRFEDSGPRFNIGAPAYHFQPSGPFHDQTLNSYPISSFPFQKLVEPTPEEDKLQNQFQNDGSFLEMFKKMQQTVVKTESVPDVVISSTSLPLAPSSSTSTINTVVPKPPIVGKRRGGRVLKTGMVKKLKKENPEEDKPKDAWSMYMNEVRKYKEASCEEEGKTRPLVK